MGSRIAGPLFVVSILMLAATSTGAGAAGPDRIVPSLSAAAARHPEDVSYIVRFATQPIQRRLGASAEGRGAFVAGRIAAATGAQRAARADLDRGRRSGTVRSYRALWIVNAIAVRSDAATLARIARLPGVVSVVPDESIELFDAPPAPSTTGYAEWGVAKVHAPEAWSLGIDGAGVTVGVIDTGVQWDHPALKAHYAGWDGTAVDHNYAWFDALSGQPAPFDQDGHGTHVTGSVVGDGGEGNRIGVAPGARFISARGCGVGSCSSSALLAAMQWMLAPTNLAGLNPDPSRAPAIVTNSWGGSCANDVFRDAVLAWVAAGIVPVFANGNSGPTAGTVTAPACYPEAIGVGATDETDAIAPFSSRGPSPIGGPKPLVSAPGVVVRSSIPGGLYTFASGTSMAAPHVAGLIALMLQADPQLDAAGVAAVLTSTAVDLGAPGADDEYGSGRVDAYAAVLAVYDGPTEGTISGTVRDETGEAVEGAALTFAPSATTAVTNPSGAYSVVLPFGDSTVSVAAQGFEAAEGIVSTSVPAPSGQADFVLRREIPDTPVVTKFRLTATSGDEAVTNRERVVVAIETADEELIDGYMVTFDRMPPAPDDATWRRSPPPWLALPAGDGAKMATLWLRDIAGRVHRAGGDTIMLDTASPDVSVEDAPSSTGMTLPRGRQIVRGRATDHGCGVALLRAAVRRGGAGRCDWWSPARQAFRPGLCGEPRWFAPSGTAFWRVSLPSSLGPSTLYSRAVDRAGNAVESRTSIGLRRLDTQDPPDRRSR